MYRLTLETMFATFLLIRCHSVRAIEESFCYGTGYYNLNSQTSEGFKSPGWEIFSYSRLPNPKASEIWGANHDQSIQQHSMTVHAVKSGNVEAKGWLMVKFSSSNSIRQLAIWATTDRNEAYGEFVNNLKSDTSCELSNDVRYSYVACSAAPASSATVPGMFIYVNLRNGGKSRKEFRLAWYASQSYCMRPKFRFMAAASKTEVWEDVFSMSGSDCHRPVKNIAQKDSSRIGPQLYASDWIEPEYYGLSSRFPLISLSCDSNSISQARPSWIKTLQHQSLDQDKWYSPRWTPSGGEDLNAVEKRATCKGGTSLAFSGRCKKSVDLPELVDGNEQQTMLCTDKNSNIGKNDFTEDYTDYKIDLSNRLENNCECPTLQALTSTGRRKRAVKEEDTEVYLDDLSYRLEDNCECPTLLALTSGRRKRSFRSNVTKFASTENITKVYASSMLVSVPIYEDLYEHNCTLHPISLEVRRGVCLFTDSGSLILGVRQWHGCTSLFVTLLITPVSISIARYFKGSYMISHEGKLPLKPWYIIHIVLIFPTIWMHASGYAAISRQRDLIGVSLMYSGYVHRTLGWASLLLILLQVITGFCRPISILPRRLAILIHWILGLIQHGLELALCIFSSQIPSSPTADRSHLDRSHFSKITDSHVPKLLVGWSIFSCVYHLFLTVRIKIFDAKQGIKSRPIFPIVLPLLPTSEEEIEYMERELWFQKIALTFYMLISIIIFIISVTAMYQRLHPSNLTYGFGAMSCSHKSETEMFKADKCQSL